MDNDERMNMVKKNPIPEDANDRFKKIMGEVRKGNKRSAELKKAADEKAKKVKAASDKARRRRKGDHRGGDDGVIDTGMFR